MKATSACNVVNRDHSKYISSLLGGCIKEDICIEAQERVRKFAQIIKSSLFEVIFIDAKGVNCSSLETVHAKKYF